MIEARPFRVETNSATIGKNTVRRYARQHHDVTDRVPQNANPSSQIIFVPSHAGAFERFFNARGQSLTVTPRI